MISLTHILLHILLPFFSLHQSFVLTLTLKLPFLKFKHHSPRRAKTQGVQRVLGRGHHAALWLRVPVSTQSPGKVGEREREMIALSHSLVSLPAFYLSFI